MIVWRSLSSLSKPLAAAVLMLALVGCSSRKSVVPVRGKVFLGGKPADGALVVFNPVGENDPNVVRPQGTVGRDGTFEMSTYKENDGVPPGEYNVSFVWLIENPKTKKEWSPLPARYMDPKNSGVRVTINEGANDLQPFALTR
ncbi:MAG TPA: hypothetical protein VE999_09065 [Gemmataceae bacterium]|nr:hypothetical protein [Gemmataceae bacterium]